MFISSILPFPKAYFAVLCTKMHDGKTFLWLKGGKMSFFYRPFVHFVYVFDTKRGGLHYLPHPTTLPLYDFIYKRLLQKGSGVTLIKKIFLEIESALPRQIRPSLPIRAEPQTHTYIHGYQYLTAVPACVHLKSGKGSGQKCQGFRAKVPRVSGKSAKGFGQNCQGFQAKLPRVSDKSAKGFRYVPNPSVPSPCKVR